jgi:hypothetical protein
MTLPAQISPTTRRSLLGSLFGLTLFFAVFGPAIGGVLFAPLALWLSAPPAVAAAAQVGWLVALIGHAALLIPAYLLGLGPAAACGFLFAIWDHVAPPSWPRALAAAAIGVALAHLLGVWIAGVGADLFSGMNFEISEPQSDPWIGPLFSPEFASALRHSLDACGAIAGGACALAANLIGLTSEKVVDGKAS